MAEETSRPPTLPSTADATPYAPVSWLAVAAMLATIMFAVLLLGAGYGAVKDKRPLLQEWLLVLPIAAIVLSFAARRVIRNAEGTRTGELFGVNLPNAAWWVSLVLLLGYGAYMLAIDVVIRREARGEVERWVNLIAEDKIPQAFDRTLPPGGRRRGVGELQAEFREELLTFRNSDLVRTALRNKGEMTFTPGSIRDWQYKPTGIDCVFTGTVRCPEGTFPVHVMLKAGEGVSGAEGVPGGRQWQIVPGTSFIQWTGSTRTPYGALLGELERQGTVFGQSFVRTFAERPGAQYFTYKGYVEPGGDPAACYRPVDTAPARAAVTGGQGIFVGIPPDQLDKHRAEVRDRLLRLPDGQTPTDHQRNQLQAVWERGTVMAPGTRLRGTAEPPTLIQVTDTAVEVRVPFETPIPGDEASVARGRVVVTATDPGLLDELKRLRTSADPDKPADSPDQFKGRQFPWRVTAIESDLVKVRQRGSGGPGGDGPGG